MDFYMGESPIHFKSNIQICLLRIACLSCLFLAMEVKKHAPYHNIWLATTGGQAEYERHASKEAKQCSIRHQFCDVQRQSIRDKVSLIFLMWFCKAVLDATWYCMGTINNIADRFQVVKHVLGNTFYMDIFLIAAWELCRNAVIFDNQHGTLQLWIRRFREEIYLQSWRLREDKRLLFIHCLDSVL